MQQRFQTKMQRESRECVMEELVSSHQGTTLRRRCRDSAAAPIGGTRVLKTARNTQPQSRRNLAQVKVGRLIADTHRTRQHARERSGARRSAAVQQKEALAAAQADTRKTTEGWNRGGGAEEGGAPRPLRGAEVVRLCCALRERGCVLTES